MTIVIDVIMETNYKYSLHFIIRCLDTEKNEVNGRDI